MGKTHRDVEAELRWEAWGRANRPEGLEKLVQLLLAAPNIADSTEGKQFLVALSHYVKVKRQRARWRSGDNDYLGRYSRRLLAVPTEGEVTGARLAKNYWLARLCDSFGDKEAMQLQEKFGHEVNNHGYQYLTRGE